MRFVDDAPLHQIREPHVRLDEVEAGILRALQRERKLTGVVERRAARIVDARAVERLPRREEPRPNSRAGFERVPVLHRLERVGRGIADRRDAPRQENAPQRFTVVLVQMRVDFNQAGNHRLVRRIDHRAGVERVAMRLDALDPVAGDDDVDVLVVGETVEGLPSLPAGPHTRGVNGLRPDGSGSRRPRQVRIDVLHGTRGDFDQLQPAAALVQDVARIAGPCRRPGEPGRQGTRWPLRRAVTADRPDREKAVYDRRHLRAVGGPHGTVVFPHADRLVRQRIEPAIRLAVERDPQHLVRALAEARRVHLERRDDQRVAVG